ncbi:MAG: hypothetical protein H7203_11170 [Rhizobacter sp.]|nr:hypothetical protein [Burkholderiales bacterium]
MKLTPTPITAALAGVVAGTVMPILWSRFDSQSMSLVVAFLLVVALPAHAFVVGFSRSQPADARALDAALLTRVGAWLSTSVVAIAFTHLVGA